MIVMKKLIIIMEIVLMDDNAIIPTRASRRSAGLIYILVLMLVLILIQ